MKKEITTMKKNTIIILDATRAQVTKAFAKQARIFGTPEYREWRAFLAENPGTEMVTKTIKKAKDKKNDARTEPMRRWPSTSACRITPKS